MKDKKITRVNPNEKENGNRCNQKKCAYNQMGGCQACETCNAEPHIINDSCDKCWNCQGDEGVLRWENDEPNKEDIKQVLKDMLKQLEKGDTEKTEKTETKTEKPQVAYVN